MTSGKCLSSAELASYVDRHLSQAERNIANEHLANCPRCVADLAGVARTVSEIAQAVNLSADTIDDAKARAEQHKRRCRQLCERARRVRVDPGMTGEYLASVLDDETAAQFIEALIERLED